MTDEGHQVEEDLQEAEAKNRLYTLLLERTRREHMAIDQQVRDKQESKRNCSEDLHNLVEHFNATRAAKELAERELAKVGATAGIGCGGVQRSCCLACVDQQVFV